MGASSIVWLVIWVGLSIYRARQKKAGTLAAAAQLSPPNLLALLVIALRTIAWCVALIALLVDATAPATWTIVAVVAPIAFPKTLLHALVVPLGRPKVSYYAARILAPLEYNGDRITGACLFGALTLARGRTKDPLATEWLRQRVEGVRPTRATGVVAMGLLASANGDDERARALFVAADATNRRQAPVFTRQVARTWLAADALRRGDFASLARLETTPWWVSRWTFATSRMARSILLGDGARKRRALTFYWLVAPHRSKTQMLLMRAIAGAASAPVVASEGSPLAHALATHRALLFSRKAPTPHAIAEAARAWSALQSSSAERASIARRALVLGANADAAIDAMLVEVQRDLVSLARATPGPIAELTTAGEVGAVCARAVRDDVFNDIESRARNLQRRHASDRALPSIEEWREVGALRARYDDAIDRLDDGGRATLFDAIYIHTVNYAAWLFNTVGERALANLIFAWLLRESIAIDRPNAVTLLTKNAAAGA